MRSLGQIILDNALAALREQTEAGIPQLVLLSRPDKDQRREQWLRRKAKSKARFWRNRGGA